MGAFRSSVIADAGCLTAEVGRLFAGCIEETRVLGAMKVFLGLSIRGFFAGGSIVAGSVLVDALVVP